VAGRYPPDLVILDLGLPDLDGVEVIQGLRGWTKAPIIVLSGRADSLDKVEALDAGADDYVTKPFGVEELLARMRAAVRRTGIPETSPGSGSASWSSTWPPSGSCGRRRCRPGRTGRPRIQRAGPRRRVSG
jgi:DNA-binding response OmpR family regulator